MNAALATVSVYLFLSSIAVGLLRAAKRHLYERSFQDSRSAVRVVRYVAFVACATGIAYALTLVYGAGLIVATGAPAGISVLFGIAVAIVVFEADERLLDTRRRVRVAWGSRLWRLADFLYARKTRERVFDQIILDWREEWCEAMSEGRRARAAWINLRGVWSFGSAMMAHGLGSVLKTAWSILRATRG